jgi:hypothetical protein
MSQLCRGDSERLFALDRCGVGSRVQASDVALVFPASGSAWRQTGSGTIQSAFRAPAYISSNIYARLHPAVHQHCLRLANKLRRLQLSIRNRRARRYRLPVQRTRRRRTSRPGGSKRICRERTISWSSSNNQYDDAGVGACRPGPILRSRHDTANPGPVW